MGIQDRFSCPVFVLESIHDEDTEVVSDTENESREDNIDNVEFDTQNPHQAQIMVQLISIGRKLIRVNSIRPYEINRARNIRNEEI